MVVVCPKCRTKYRVAEDRLPGGSARLRCSGCGEVFLIKRKAAPSGGPPLGEPAALPTVVAGRKVLVAHPAVSMCEMIGDLLRGAGFVPVFAKNGIEAIAIMGDIHPDLVVVDVALPDIFGFEFPEIIKKDQRLSGIKVMLIASIYDRTRYKRMPLSLYGADDFIEKHNLGDSLVSKINGLLGRQEKATASPVSAQPDASSPGWAAPPPNGGPPQEQPPLGGPPLGEQSPSGEPAIPHVAEDHGPRSGEGEAPGMSMKAQEVEKAKRLARIIVSDIALYNHELIEQGIRRGSIEDAVQIDLDEGRRLFDRRVPEEIRREEDFLLESLNELLEKRKKEMGMEQ